MKALTKKDRPRLQQQLERVLTIVIVLSSSRRGMTRAEVAREVNNSLGSNYSGRTVQRDMRFLERMAVVSSQQGEQAAGGDFPPLVWRWRSSDYRASALAMASRMSRDEQEARDAS